MYIIVELRLQPGMQIWKKKGDVFFLIIIILLFQQCIQNQFSEFEFVYFTKKVITFSMLFIEKVKEGTLLLLVNPQEYMVLYRLHFILNWRNVFKMCASSLSMQFGGLTVSYRNVVLFVLSVALTDDSKITCVFSHVKIAQ